MTKRVKGALDRVIVVGREAAVDRRAWAYAGIASAVVGWGANQFAPMLLVYREHLGLSAATVQAMFGLYALGLIPGLLVCGPVSDRVGRRPAMLFALAASAVATLLLIAGGVAPVWLFVGRLAAGVASGAAFSSGVAWIKELSTAAGDAGAGARRATVAMTIGFGGGPLVAGLLAQWAPAPTVLGYLPHLGLLVAALALLPRAPETRVRGRSAGAASRLRLADPRAPRFVGVVLLLAPWVFGSAAIALAYLPGLVEDRLGHAALAFASVVTTLTALSGIAIQPVARRVAAAGPTRLLVASLGVVVVGVLVAAAAATTTRPALVVLAALVLGAGYGACQVCGLAEVARLARPESLAGLTGIYQAVSYLGFALPYLLASADRALPTGVPLLVVAALAMITLLLTVRCARRTTWRSRSSMR